MEIATKIVVRNGFHVALVLHSETVAPEGDWARAFATYTQLAADTKQEPSRARLFVISDGGTPDTRQRRMLGELWKNTPIKTAVVIPGLGNPIKRGIMTALTWINPSMAFFTPARVDSALAHVELPEQISSIWPELMALQTLTPHNSMLEAIGKLTGQVDVVSSRKLGTHPQPKTGSREG